jgi:hypothetical protein
VITIFDLILIYQSYPSSQVISDSLHLKNEKDSSIQARGGFTAVNLTWQIAKKG